MTIPRLRWAVVWVNLDPTKGDEERGTKPALVVSEEAFHAANRMTVVPILPGVQEERFPGSVAIPPDASLGLPQGGLAVPSELRTLSVLRLDKDRMKGLAPILDSPVLRWQIRSSLADHLGLDLTPAVDGTPPQAGSYR